MCRTLAATTIRHIHFILSGTYKRAVRWGRVSESPTAKAEPPAAPTPNPQPPTAAEAARIVTESWRDPDWGALVWTAMTAGTRRGELWAIRRSLALPTALPSGTTRMATRLKIETTLHYADRMKLAKYSGATFVGWPIRPTTRSSIHIGGSRPNDAPVISPRYLETEEDRAATSAILDWARNTVAQPPLADLIEGEDVPGPAVTSREQVIRYALDSPLGICHAVGSAAMDLTPRTWWTIACGSVGSAGCGWSTPRCLLNSRLVTPPLQRWPWLGGQPI
ncbi:MAG: hypothetical protein ABS81_10050 [Pseudonocardia sp. SCN 72-86]|nr:MAG: hypothetical protein ABS81_10050 [Pseudonocardia sp. SCN 72-86]